MLRRHHRRLRRCRLPVLREAVGLDLVGLAVDLGDAGLVHHRQPDVLPSGIELDVEAALRLFGLEHRDRDVLRHAGLRVHHADELVGEVGVPDLAVLIDDHVMGLRLFARQVVFRDDDLGGHALRTRQRLEVVFLPVGVREAHAVEPFRGGRSFLRGDRRTLAARSGKQRLRTCAGVLPGE